MATKKRKYNNFLDMLQEVLDNSVTETSQPYTPRWEQPQAITSRADSGYTPRWETGPTTTIKPFTSMDDPRLRAAVNDASYVKNYKSAAQADILESGSVAPKTREELEALLKANRYSNSLQAAPPSNEKKAKTYGFWRETLDPENVDPNQPYVNLLGKQAASEQAMFGQVTDRTRKQLEWFSKRDKNMTLKELIDAESTFRYGNMRNNADVAMMEFGKQERGIPGGSKLQTALMFTGNVGKSAYNQLTQLANKTGLDKGVEAFTRARSLSTPVALTRDAPKAVDPEATTGANYLGFDPDTFQSNKVGFMEGIKHPEKLPFSRILAQTEAGAKAMENPIASAAAEVIGGSIVDPLSWFSGHIARPAMSAEKAQSIANMVTDARTASSAGKAATKAEARTILAEAAATGAPIAPKEAMAEAATKVTELIRAEEKNKLLEKTMGEVQLRLLGKRIGGSTKLYEVPRAILNKMPGKTGVGVLFDGSQFNIGKGTTRHLAPYEAHVMERAAESSMVPLQDELITRMNQKFSHLKPDDWDAVMRSMTTGSGLPPTKAGLSPVVTEVKKELDDFYAQQVKAGKFGSSNPNVPEYYPAYFVDDQYKGGGFSVQAWKQGRQAWFKNLAQDREALNQALISGSGVAEARAKLAKTEALSSKYGWEAFTRLPKQAGPIVGPEAMRAEALQTVRALGNEKLVKGFVNEFAVPAQPRITAHERRVYEADGMIRIGPKDDIPLAKYLDQDYWVPSAMWDVFAKSTGVFSQLPELRSFSRMVNKINMYAKTAVTSANPAYHINNFMGDIQVNWMDGVVSPIPYIKTMAYKAGQPVKWRVGNITMSGDEAFHHFLESGARTGYIQAEMSALREQVGKGMNWLQGVSTGREDLTRLPHFMDAWAKEARGAKNIDEVLEARKAAAARVIKFNHDFGDITKFEQQARAWIWFYTWTRKNLPLQLEMMAMRPGKYAQMFRGFDALQQLFDVTLPGDARKRVLDTYVPEWLRPLTGMYTKVADATDTGGQLFQVPNTPMSDFTRIAQSGGPVDMGRQLLRGLGQQVTPIAKVPWELTTERRLTGEPINDKSDYLMGQTPATGLLNIFMSDDKSERAKVARLLSWLLNARLVEQSEKQTGGALYGEGQDRSKRLSAAKKKLQNEALRGSK